MGGLLCLMVRVEMAPLVLLLVLAITQLSEGRSQVIIGALGLAELAELGLAAGEVGDAVVVAEDASLVAEEEGSFYSAYSGSEAAEAEEAAASRPGLASYWRRVGKFAGKSSASALIGGGAVYGLERGCRWIRGRNVCVD